ncbi:hypothetical protein RND81_14G105500 [Saponaria officinalis]|uniref:Leucine-rich repeat-containing N-terminal plant-type domain-containing protein n=1 Tax=Saponaria officinalis TaxID=3572 RepID=A0AAW1GNB9_SAPOF
MTPHFPFKSYDHRLVMSLFYIWLTYLTSHAISGINNKDVQVQCLDKERDALLQFKHGIHVDHCGLLASWGGNPDCCHWDGIRCDNDTGTVIGLQLPGYVSDKNYSYCLEGTVSGYLVEMKHLKYLDLSGNNFSKQSIPKFIGSLPNLEYLNLSHAWFNGVIPREIGNLSKLSSLDLSHTIASDRSLSWLTHLRILRDINLGGIDFSLVPDWVSVINSLPYLEVLFMDDCDLSIQRTSSHSNSNTSSTLHVISLSLNQFNGNPFRLLYKLISNETRLTYLDLSLNYYQLPLENLSFIWNMNSLSHLDVSFNGLSGHIPREIESMHNLSFLNLDFNTLSGPIPREIWNVGELSYLSLAGNRLDGSIPNSISNLKHLTFLDLSSNKLRFDKHAMNSLGKLCKLQTLRLHYNDIRQEFSQVLQSLSSCAHKSLVYLFLSNTQLWGSVTNIIDNFTSLEALDVHSNQLNGTISERIAQLSRLEALFLFNNNLNGVVSPSHFSNLSRLSDLDLSNNQALVFNLSTDWIPPFLLEHLGLGSCKIGPMFPKWLLTQQNLAFLDISGAQISDIVPESFWSSVSSTIQQFNMSNNMISGVLPDLPTFQTLYQFDMSLNNLSGAVPSSLGNCVEVHLNNNKLSQGLYRFLCPKTEMNLGFLDLSNNLFFEMLPDCWRYFPHLTVLKLQNNNIGGKLPSSIFSSNFLEALHLRNNTISGELPMSWVNSTSLAVLDLGYNSLSGYILPTFGNGFKSLSFLSLRNNHFSMAIPSSICQLSSLLVLDLSNNHISGTLPKCLSDLTTMVSTKHFPQTFVLNYTFLSSFLDSDIAWFMWKRKEHNFDDLSGLYKGIDISNNNLQGPIPDEISSLAGLVFLNLSQNNLSGGIPSRIGQLTSLEFLDLSHNRLSGQIPTSLASISFLEILDLSENKLSGRIPSGTQLQGFDASAYMGNPGLCGAPLPTCPGDERTPIVQNGDNTAQPNEHESDDLILGLYISVVLGVITGFWGVCGSLVLKRSRRRAFFRFWDDTKDKVYVLVVVNIARACRRS